MDNLNNFLQSRYGFSEFRPGQEEVVASILSGRDTLALMPTGGGKSLCYQLPALQLPGTTIVISPLIALMKDQVDGLRSKGIAASFINSSLSDDEVSERTLEFLAGQLKLMYIAPERLANGFINSLQQVPIALVAVDEAHCISSWGHDFRPDYMSIASYIDQLPKRPVVAAFTATATPEVKDDICRRLVLQNPNIFVRGFDRPNLKFVAKGNLRDRERDEEVLRLARKLEGSGIIYCGTRDKTEELAMFLQEEGEAAAYYHAGMESEERSLVQEAFMKGEVRIIVATIAFGMGVDKADVRFVIHAHLPASLENYYQEAGRAGRDNMPSTCVLLASPKDQALHQYFIKKNYEEAIKSGSDSEEANMVRQMRVRKLHQMYNYVKSAFCRRLVILNYFYDQSTARVRNCQGCDICVRSRL